ncbi:hypothetical protein ABZ920_00850 [Streptomyces sp. NPDC046831]|uniref:hypothetical protein n=1 Tax=Streptomyces sp. NPDC046831 TaxID=3154805 RepID=UPI0033CE9A2C
MTTNARLATVWAPWSSRTVTRRRLTRHDALQHIQAEADEAGNIDCLVQIDSIIVRAHRVRRGDVLRAGQPGCPVGHLHPHRRHQPQHGSVR